MPHRSIETWVARIGGTLLALGAILPTVQQIVVAIVLTIVTTSTAYATTHIIKTYLHRPKQ